MSSTVSIPLEEVKEVFLLLEDLHDFLHQPLNYESSASVDGFLKAGAYDRLHRAYYDVAWKWLPKAVQEEMLNR